MNKILSVIGIIVVLSIILCTYSSAAIVPIDATLKAVDASGNQTFTDSVEIVGVVTNIKGSLGASYFSYYIQDTATGWGIDVYHSGTGSDPAYSEGDLMDVQGTVTGYNGCCELAPSETTVKLGSGYGYSTTVVASISLMTTFDQTLASGGEYYEGRVVKLYGVHTVSGTWGSNGTVYITDSSGAQMSLFLPAAFQVFSRPAPTGNFSVVGIASQRDTSSPYTVGYQIIPRIWSDIDDGTVVYPAPVISNSMYSPGIPTSTDSVFITATISFDSTATPGEVWVYTNAVGNAQMFDNGTNGDVISGDSVYSAYLPPGSNGANVGWYINAKDNNYLSGINDPSAAPGTVYYYPIRNNPTIEPIQTVRNATNGTNHIVRGRVIAAPGNIASTGNMYIQDTSGGIKIYGSKMRSLAEGDQVTVMGTLASYSGEKELDVTPTATENAVNKDTAITVTTPTAKNITTATLNTDSTIQATLVKLTNVGYATGWSWDSVISNSQTKVDDGSGATIMYIYGATGITDPGSTRFDVVGVAAAFGSNTAPTRELKPRHQSDFTANVVVAPPNDMNVNPGETVQFTASGGTEPYTWSVITVSGTNVGSISTTGLFTAGPGLGTCTVRATDSGLKTGDSGTISVVATSAPIYIEPQSVIKVR
ncbi:MAG: choice-of-anchor X domain-containing protein [bacterium]